METDSQKCHLCTKEQPGCEWQEIGKYWLCLHCQNKIRMRQAEARAEKYKNAGFFINREELLGLKSDGLIPTRTYVYFALKIDYPNGLPKAGVEIFEFCSNWGISQSDLLSAMGGLAKKGIVVLETKKLEIMTRTRAERVAAMESALNQK